MRDIIKQRTPWVLLNYGFRPFFLLNGIFAAVIIALWLARLHGAVALGAGQNPILWHAHELLFGFGGAAIAGFLLTAVSAWTGRIPVQGAKLGLLVAAWLLGRLAMTWEGESVAWLTALLELSFPVLLAAVVLREVVAGKSRNNYFLAGVVCLFPVTDLLYHLGYIGVLNSSIALIAIYLVLHLVMVLITLIGGRIIPSFTANWLRARQEKPLPRSAAWLERTIIPLTVAVALADIWSPLPAVTGILALCAALAHGWRLANWRGLATWSEPLLAVLHLGYAWLVIGYGLLGSAELTAAVPRSAALHALTMGAMGTMILAVMSRVALGHTGRSLHAAHLTVTAYALVSLAAGLRITAPLTGAGYMALIDLSGAVWIAAFAIFSWVYWPILLRPRVDGKPERHTPVKGKQRLANH
jgi:uncharacterized protein involved in response to NO